MSHSVCCILPVIFFTIGLTSAGQYLEFMHGYENVMILVNLSAITFGYYMFYLHKYSSCDHKHCHTSKKPFWIITIISLILLVIPEVYKSITH